MTNWRRVLSRAARLDVPLTLAIVAGTALRLDQILDQIPLDDEWHALHNIVRYDYGWLLTHFGWTDFSIPLAVYDKLVADTIGLSELSLRAPVLLAGIAALILFPLATRVWIGRPASQVFAWFLALSPLHVFFSRFARPYGISLTCTFLGILAFFSWWTRGRRRDAAAFAACAVIGPLFHLTTLPFLVAPFAYAALAGRLPRDETAQAPSPRQVLRLALAVAFGLMVFIGAPLVMSYRALAYKGGHGSLVGATWLQGFALLSGARHPSLALIVAALAIAGFAILWRRRRALALYLALVSLSTPTVVLLTHPTMIDWPIVLARYCLPLLPIVLVLAALTLASAGAALRRAWKAAPSLSLGMAFCVASFLLGPLPMIHYRPNNWLDHGAFQYAYRSSPAETTCPATIPAFYGQLAQLAPESALIVEAPWHFGWETNSFPCYQHLHRQRMLIGFVGPRDAAHPSFLPRPGELPENGPGTRFRFRSFVHVDDSRALRDRAVRYVIFHRNLGQELPHGGPSLDVDVSNRIQEYRTRYGAAIYKDERLVVFDVTGGPTT